MGKVKLDSIDIFKFVGIAIVFATMGLCQFHKPSPIQIPKEMWTIITNIVTATLLSISGIEISSTSFIKHMKGWITLTLIAMVGASIIFEINVGKEWWSLLGAATAFLYGTGKKE